MELLGGDDLEMIFRREQRLTVGRGLKIMAQVCLALSAAHDSGVLHRNLKPRNIHVEQIHELPDFVKICDFDFGINQEWPLGDYENNQEGLLGTPLYMAPEIMTGARITERSDIYAAGVILYEMFAGEPFPCSLSVLLKAKLDGALPDVCARFADAGIPISVGALVKQCLAIEPAERPASARWVADRLADEIKLLGMREQILHWSTFLSYGGPDEPFARKLYEALHRNGVTTFFFPEHAEPGEKLHRMMRKGVNEHDRVLLICSRSSLDRKGVLNELEEILAREARDGGASYLIPIRRRGAGGRPAKRAPGSGTKGRAR